MTQRSSLEGNLGFISLADVFQILGGNASTGTLEVSSPYAPYPGQVFFEGGNPVNATCGPLNALEAVYALFGWVDGRFAFREEEVRSPHVIKQGRMQIVLDALRMLDDGVIKKAGSFEEESTDLAASGEAPEEKEGPKPIHGPLVDYAFIIGEEEFGKGERILREGGHGKWIWVILEGSVDVRRDTSDGPILVARLGEGCFLGTFAALLFKEHARSANVLTLDTVRLGLLDTERLSKIYTSLTPDMKAVLSGLDHRLQAVTDQVVEMHERRDTLKDLPGGGETVMELGSSREELFRILDGTGLVVLQSKKGPLPLAPLGKEDIFGFVPFLDIGHEPRSAAIVASKGMRTKPLDVEALQEEYKQLPSTFKNLIYHTGVCIYSTTRLAQELHETS